MQIEINLTNRGREKEVKVQGMMLKKEEKISKRERERVREEE